MSKGEEVLAQLKFDSDINIAKAALWSDEEAAEMLETYQQTLQVAKESKNTDLLLIAQEKISQLNQAIELKKLDTKKPSVSTTQPSV